MVVSQLDLQKLSGISRSYWAYGCAYALITRQASPAVHCMYVAGKEYAPFRDEAGKACNEEGRRQSHTPSGGTPATVFNDENKILLQIHHIAFSSINSAHCNPFGNACLLNSICTTLLLLLFVVLPELCNSSGFIIITPPCLTLHTVSVSIARPIVSGRYTPFRCEPGITLSAPLSSSVSSR